MQVFFKLRKEVVKSLCLDMLKEIDSCLVPSRLSLCLSLVARGVWWEGGKLGRESSSLFHSHHPLLPPRALREDEWDESELIPAFELSISRITYSDPFETVGQL